MKRVVAHQSISLSDDLEGRKVLVDPLVKMVYPRSQTFSGFRWGTGNFGAIEAPDLAQFQLNDSYLEPQELMPM